MEKIRVASVQIQHEPGNKEANFRKIEGWMEKAKKQKADIVIFPEMCITGYWHVRNLSKEKILDLAEPVPEGPSVSRLLRLSKQFGMVLTAGLIEKAADGKLYNAYIAAQPDGTWSRHRKIHCFISEHVDSGSDITVFETPFGWKAGILICYDNNIGENVRLTALKGADLLLAPHQTGGCASNDPNIMGIIDRKLWDNRENNPQAIEAELKGDKGRGWLLRWLPARAHDNGLFLAFSNGVGPDDNEVRTGNAMILDPYGRILTETWKAGDEMVIADLDPSLLSNSTGRRWIKTRRPELYSGLARPTGLEEDTRKIRFDNKGA